MSPALVIVVVGSLIAASCALVGSFLVLRRMALLGDAISHAVLPGIAIAFLLTGDRSPLPMVLGAGALGVLTVFLVELLNRSRRMREDASIGVVFPALFSIGVILVSRYADNVHLDLDCVLYGEIAYSPWDLLLIGERSYGPEALWVGGGVLLLDLLLVTLLYKELKVSTFDAGLAASLGISPVLMHYVLMSAVSLTVVGSFEAVGAILVVAMLVVPPATAYLLTDRLSRMLMLSVALGVLSSVLGYLVARTVDCSIAGAMAAVAGLLFLVALLFSPTHGVLARWVTHRRVGNRVADQLVMLHLGTPDRLVARAEVERRFGWKHARLDRVLRRLARAGWVERSSGGLRLTSRGAGMLTASGRSALAHPVPGVSS